MNANFTSRRNGGPVVQGSRMTGGTTPVYSVQHSRNQHVDQHARIAQVGQGNVGTGSKQILVGVPAGRYGQRKHTQRLATGYIAGRITYDHNLVTPKPAARVCMRTFHCHHGESGTLLTIRSEGTEGEKLTDTCGVELEPGALCDVAGEEGQANITILLQSREQCLYSGVDRGGVVGRGHFDGKLAQVDVPEAADAGINCGIIQTSERQQLASDLRIRFAIEGMCSQRSRGAVHFEERSLERTASGAVRTEQG